MKRVILTILLIVVALITPTVCVVKRIQFKQDCSGYLKQAADANTAEMALDRVNKALEYIERNNLTDGYTSVLWKTEDENIGFWYENIKACKAELEACLGSSQLEKTNVLMKVRESLTDSGEKGTVLTIPGGIYKYPHNLAFFICMCLSGIIGFILFVRLLNWVSKNDYWL